MRHTLRLHGVVIGYSELEDAELSTGRASGPFRPGAGYELVQPVFRIFALAAPHDGSPADQAGLERYYRARDKLALELADDDGRRVGATAIHIADYTIEEGPSAIAIDVLIKDDDYWERRVREASAKRAASNGSGSDGSGSNGSGSNGGTPGVIQ